jgi:P-aminobenzoate N-oxygenase AurF
VFVLGGEDPIDHVQRTALRSGRELHPLLERIMRIHVTEEARHLSFARQYLRTNVPMLSSRRRYAIAIQAPFILAEMASVMMRPPRSLVREYAIPKDVLAEAYGPASSSRDETRASLRKVRNLLTELGLITAPAKRLWKTFGIWDEPAAAK